MGNLALFVLYWFFAVLAVYRLAYMITADNGPAHIFKRIREWAHRRWGPDSWQYEGATCFFCQSVWYSFPAALCAVIMFPFLQMHAVIWCMALWFSIAGAAQILHWRVLVWMATVEKS